MQLYKLNQLLIDMHSGGTPDTSKPEYWNGNFKWLSSGETRQRFIENTESRITQLGIEKSSTKLAKKSDVVMACAGQGKTRGQVSFLLDDMYINQSVIAMTTDEKILHPLYLFFNLSGRYNELRGSSDANSTRGSITTKSLKKLAMLIPNIESQKNITDILIAYDNLIENNNKRIRLLEQMAESLYKEWFIRFRFPGAENTEFENGIPKGWKIERLSDIADIIMGQSPKSENYNTNCDGLPFHQGVGSYGDFYLIDDIYSTKGNRIAEANSIIFSVRAPVGRINITLNKIILGRGVASINSVKGYNAYLLWMLKNQFQQEDIIGNGSIFTSVTKKELFGFKILMPHDNLIQKFDSIAFGIESEMRKLSLINDNLAKQRDMLLPRLMSGELEV